MGHNMQKMASIKLLKINGRKKVHFWKFEVNIAAESKKKKSI
mgnify:CR=1 FL=1